jgi:hypothetical protein
MGLPQLARHHEEGPGDEVGVANVCLSLGGGSNFRDVNCGQRYWPEAVVISCHIFNHVFL